MLMLDEIDKNNKNNKNKIDDIIKYYGLNIRKGNLSIKNKVNDMSKEISFDPVLDIERNIFRSKRRNLFGDNSNVVTSHDLIEEKFKYNDSEIIAEKRIQLHTKKNDKRDKQLKQKTPKS